MAIEPVTREERFLAAAGGQSVTPPTPITRKEQLLQGIIDAVKSGGATPDVIEGAVNDYLNANPVKPGATTEQAAQIEQNKNDIADLHTEVDELKESGGNDSGQNVAQIEPAEDDIPCVYFDTGGKGMPFNKTDGEVQVLMRYISKTATIERPVTAKVQGSSSASNAGYKKRNWTIKVFKDSTYEDKEKIAFKGWPAMNKFVLKAGWVIPGHLRNVGAAKVWGQIMRSRADFDTLPTELRNSPNLGATDGFHGRVFIDGVYWGIYDWIVSKDQLFGQDKDNTAHSILNSELNNQPTCAFATTSPTINGNWSEELQDSMTAATKTSMENWIKFVAGSTDEEFVANAEQYFDVQSVIDADCFDRIIVTVDNMCRNQIVFKYDKKWYMGKWDLDAILGLPPVDGQAWYPYNTAYQEGYVAHKDYGIINMLYKRTEELFLERFKARYWELRNGPLSENNLVRVFGQLSDRLRSIEGLLAEENASTTGNGQFTGMPNVGKDTIQQIREFVVKRCGYMDGIIANMVGTVPCTGITLNTNTLTFAESGSQTITATVTPDGCTDVVTWESDNTSVATVSGGVVTAVANGNATITAKCGDYSATCTVSVSGIAEPVACTGITLDKSELTFDGEGEQTITATVEPSDTTDSVVWESSNPAVVSIAYDGNVCTAQSVGNGEAIVTATCGMQTANCAVSVSGIEKHNILDGATWSYGSINGMTGAAIEGTIDCMSSYFDVSAYQGQFMWLKVTGALGMQSQKILCFDAEKNFIGAIIGLPGTRDAMVGGIVPSNAVYARCGMLSAAEAVTVYTANGGVNIFTPDGSTAGEYYEPTDGTVKTYAQYSCKLLECADSAFYMNGALHGAFFDNSDTYLGPVDIKVDKNEKFIYAPTGATKMGVNYFTADESSVVVMPASNGNVIGTSVNTLT